MSERFEYRPPEQFTCDKAFIIEQLGLMTKESDQGLLELQPESPLFNIEVEKKNGEAIVTPEQLYSYFEDYPILEADPVTRPENNTTLFTTAGIQHIETILARERKLDKQSFVIAQPSVRSQYIDKTKEGTSTAFVNFCIADVHTSPHKFAVITQQYISMLIKQGAHPQELKFTIEDNEDRWGEKQLHKTTVTVLYNNIELGEGVYIHDYPITEDENIPITDISFGTERLNWGLRKSGTYFPGFEKFYTEAQSETEKNSITAAIDCIRTATLLAGEGIVAAHNNPGRILRQLSKRFAIRNKDIKLSIGELVTIANDYWKTWGFRPNKNIQTMTEELTVEHHRALNVRLATLLKARGGPALNMDVNQSLDSYFRTLHSSTTPKIQALLNEIIKEII